MILRALAFAAALLASVCASAQTVTVSPTLPAQPNLLINQFLNWDQRNVAANVNSNGTYSVDGWKANFVLTTATTTGWQQRTVADFAPYIYSLRATVNSGAAMAAGDHVGTVQNIEGFRLAGSGIGTASAAMASITLNLQSSVSGAVIAVSLQNQARNRSYVHNCTLTGTSNTLCQFTVPLDTTGTWLLTEASIGMRVEINFGCGSSNQITADTWTASTGYCTSGSTNVAATSSATVTMGPTKFEISPAPTPFIPLDTGVEYTQVARYYQKTFPTTVKPAQSAGITGTLCTGTNSAAAGSTEGVQWNFAPKMVQTPTTVTSFNPSASNANWRDSAAADIAATVDPSSAKGASGVYIAVSGTPAAVSRTACIHAIAESGF